MRCWGLVFDPVDRVFDPVDRVFDPVDRVFDDEAGATRTRWGSLMDH